MAFSFVIVSYEKIHKEEHRICGLGVGRWRDASVIAPRLSDPHSGTEPHSVTAVCIEIERMRQKRAPSSSYTTLIHFTYISGPMSSLILIWRTNVATPFEKLLPLRHRNPVFYGRRPLKKYPRTFPFYPLLRMNCRTFCMKANKHSTMGQCGHTENGSLE